jgi:hypothetical protein
MRIAILGCLLASFAVQAALAVPLPQGSSLVRLPGTTPAAEPNLAGAIVEDVVTPFHYFREIRDAGVLRDRQPIAGTVQSQAILFLDTNARGYNRAGHYVVDSSLSFGSPTALRSTAAASGSPR